MKYIQPFRSRFTILALMLGLPLGAAAGLQAQTVEAEPNNSCAAAQDLSTATSPVNVTGSLDSPPFTPDVDYYRFAGNPGDTVLIDHRRSGASPLPDPYIGVFAGDCLTLLASDDDSGGNFGSRLAFAIPEDGQFVVAASSYGDYELSGHGASAGTYTLSVARQVLAEGVLGRLIDAETDAGACTVTSISTAAPAPPATPTWARSTPAPAAASGSIRPASTAPSWRRVTTGSESTTTTTSPWKPPRSTWLKDSCSTWAPSPSLPSPP